MADDEGLIPIVCLFVLLQSLYISDCAVYMDDMALTRLLELKELTIESANLKTAPSLQAINRNLISLKLTNNHIVYLDEHYFEGCERLIYVHLNNNFLEIMPQFSYIKHTVEIIGLTQNRLGDSGALCEITFTKLINLELSFNSISYMKFTECLDRWPNIKYIHVENNQLKTLPDFNTSNKESPGQDVWLAAHNNPYCCDSSMLWMTRGQEEDGYYDVAFGRIRMATYSMNSIKCQEPEPLYGSPIWKLSNDTIHSPPYHNMPVPFSTPFGFDHVTQVIHANAIHNLVEISTDKSVRTGDNIGLS